MNCSPSFESSTFASAAVQNAKESFTAATSLSFGSVSAIFTSGAVCPEIFEQNVLFDCAMCITRCPNEFISGEGLNTYFSAGIASAAATMFFSYRDRKSTRLNSSHGYISYAVFCLKKKKIKKNQI